MTQILENRIERVLTSRGPKRARSVRQTLFGLTIKEDDASTEIAIERSVKWNFKKGCFRVSGYSGILYATYPGGRYFIGTDGKVFDPNEILKSKGNFDYTVLSSLEGFSDRHEHNYPGEDFVSVSYSNPEKGVRIIWMPRTESLPSKLWEIIANFAAEGDTNLRAYRPVDVDHITIMVSYETKGIRESISKFPYATSIFNKLCPDKAVPDDLVTRVVENAAILNRQFQYK